MAAVLSVAEGLEGLTEAEWRPTDLRRICAEVGEGLSELGGPARLRFASAPDGQVVECDPTITRRLLHHVIENALKFSPQGSVVDVGARRAGGVLEIRVRDRGPGIEEDFLDRAFDVFTQADQSDRRATGGLGIGLFAARRLVEPDGGQIELLRHPDGGTEALLAIPQPDAARMRDSSVSPEAATSRS